MFAAGRYRNSWGQLFYIKNVQKHVLKIRYGVAQRGGSLTVQLTLEQALLNSNAKRLCNSVTAEAALLDVRVTHCGHGATILDFGTDRIGTLRAGIELAKICMADLADIRLLPGNIEGYPLPLLQVMTDHPLRACIASQYAGWPFSTERFFSMCSGPARVCRGREEILTAYELHQSESEAVGVFEANQIPDDNDLLEFADQCGLDVAHVTICIARTGSLPGILQIVARSVETAMHKLFERGFDLRKVQRAIGTAPLPPSSQDDYQSMGWTNDAILYGGDVTLWVDGVDDLQTLARQLPSCTSDEFGKPFIEIFAAFDRDFYKVDRQLFSPARITLTCIRSGETVVAGELRPDLLQSSFGWKR